MSTSRRSYGFVLPRFGREIGGAETLVGALAGELARRGDEVELFTTCAKDNRTWENAYPAGLAPEYPFPVTRFPVDVRDLESWIPKQISISQGMMLPLDDQLEWMKHGVNSTALYEHLAREGVRFDALIFAPYLFGTTFWGSLIRPERSFLIPCLHDESYAYTEIVQSMFRQVKGAIFNAAPEQDLARRLYGEISGGEVGMGFEPLPSGFVESLEPFFGEESPYVLYVGRKETGKNAQLLIDYFITLKDRFGGPQNLKLVLVGGGDFSDLYRPQALERGDVIDLSHVSEREKQQLIRHATVLCQPSTNESFSIVLMEAWLLGTPVLVHERCAVTSQHVKESGGGLYFDNEIDFAGAVRTLTGDKDLRAALAASGALYVEQKYSWDSVLKRFDRVMDEMIASP